MAAEDLDSPLIPNILASTQSTSRSHLVAPEKPLQIVRRGRSLTFDLYIDLDGEPSPTQHPAQSGGLALIQ
jgi:hypothetical protein